MWSYVSKLLHQSYYISYMVLLVNITLPIGDLELCRTCAGTPENKLKAFAREDGTIIEST